jgi:TonB-linked SusC/RagA family outer membrane protein
MFILLSVMSTITHKLCIFILGDGHPFFEHHLVVFDMNLKSTWLSLILLIISLPSFAQTVQGVIVDETGETMIGATVVVKGTTRGTVTDVDGKYMINAADGDILIFSYVGYLKIEEPVNGRNSIDITLKEDLQQLDEVVVVGFGVQQKKYLTGSVAKVDGGDLTKQASTSADAALQGRAAGVQVTQSHGIAGSPVSIRVRGTSSFEASSEPLYVVDGVPLTSGNFSVNSANNYTLAPAQESNALATLNPADIESIEILKDASAAAIYGARGANGVVLITTKNGKAGKTQFNVNYYTGVSKETRRVDMLNTEEYFMLAEEAWVNAGRTTEDDFSLLYRTMLEPYGLTREQVLEEGIDTDWIDEALRTGVMQEASLSASGGNEKTKFYVGGTFRDEQGIMVGDAFQRLSGRINIDHQVNDKFSLGARVGLTYTDRDIVEVSWGGGIGTAQQTALPFYPVYNPDGTFFEPQRGFNLVAERENTDMQHQATAVLGNLYAQYEFIPGLTGRIEAGLNNIYSNEHYYKSQLIEPDAVATDIVTDNPSWNFNGTLNYTKQVGSSNFSILAGTNAYRSSFTAHQIDGIGFANPAFTNPENATIQEAIINVSEFSFFSYFGRAEYRYKDRYLASVTTRRDASSRFGAANRWGTFPAVSVGWIISEENFLANASNLSFLKLRASVGLVGNAEIGNFTHFGSFTSEDYANLPGIIGDELGNDLLGWETTRQVDIAMEAGFLDGRFQGTLGVYRKDTRDLLSGVSTSIVTGFQSTVSNIGSLRNQGVELHVTSHNLTGAFKWMTDFNVAYNHNEVTSLEGAVVQAGLFGALRGITEGEPIGTFNYVPFAGVSETDQTLEVIINENGDTEMQDVQGGDWLFINQYGSITGEYNFENDFIYAGNSVPTWTGGLTNQFSWRNWSLDVLMTFAAGHQIDNGEQRYQNAPFGYGWNAQTYLLDRWQQDGDVTDVPALVWDDERERVTDRTIYDASYLRLRSVSFAYEFPRSALEKLKISRLRLYLRGTNLGIITSYPGWDPEYNRDGPGNDGQSRSWLPTPQAMTGILGLDLTF